MTLKRYLLAIYFLTLGGLLILCALMADDQDFPLAPMLVESPVIASVNTFVNVWPWARMVPVEKRTSFRSYRATNIFMAFGGALLVICIVLQVMELMNRN
jgi:hypothetical protein